MTWDDETTLGAARDWLRERLDEGAPCPCCTQEVKVYRRKIHSTMARLAIRGWHVAGRPSSSSPLASGGGEIVEPLRDGAAASDYFYLPDLTSGHNETADVAKLRYWGLLVGLDLERDDGSARNGWWALTPRGIGFVRRELRVPKYARVYNSRCLGLVGDPVSISDCLGSRFHYDELMEGI